MNLASPVLTENGGTAQKATLTDSAIAGLEGDLGLHRAEPEGRSERLLPAFLPPSSAASPAPCFRGFPGTGHQWHSLKFFLNIYFKCVSLPPLLQFSSVAQSCPTLCDPMNCSTPGLPVHHQLPEFTQIYVHRVSDAIQPSVVPFSSCPQSLPASGSFPMSQL